MATLKKQSFPLLEPNLIDALGLMRVFGSTPLLKEWLEVTGELSVQDMYLLTACQSKLIKNADSWNEEELKMQFISMVMFLANVSDTIRTYYDREISEDVEDIFLLCKADMMLSKGIGELMKAPYFFMHEYKREKSSSFGGTERGFGDPVGQMLAAMLIGQAKNKNKNPMYGCYVQGRFWFFSILIGKEYVVSKSFDASEMDEAQQIVFILRKMNTIILERLMD
jgi:hypothetical protein